MKPKEVWAIRVRLQLERRWRDLALFNLAIDSKLRGCDLVRLRVNDVCASGQARDRATVIQRKTGRPVQFEITEETRTAIREWLADGALLPLLLGHALPTTLDALIGFGLASGLGVGLAVALSYSRLLREMLYPNLVLFQLVPKVALAPLFVVWLGIGSHSQIAFAAFGSFFPVAISAALGFANVEVSALRLCRSLTASEWQSFTMVRFPFALPAIFSGMKIATTMAVIGIIIGEFISSKAGLGFYIMLASSRMETAAVFAALLLLCVIGVALFGAVALAEMLVRRVYGRR